MTAAHALRLAHRGDWRLAPENSLAAMHAALQNPACDGLEFDVRQARDGTPILLHDETLDRVQGVPGRPTERSVEELAEIGVPTLAAVLEAVGPGPFLDIEMKGEPVPSVVEVLEDFRGTALAHAVLSSFELETLRWLAAVRPGWPRWLNADDLTPETISTAIDLGCMAISVDWRSITRPALARADAAGLEVAAWTVRRPSTAERLERLGVVAICVEGPALDG